jgi:hypothetical protein
VRSPETVDVRPPPTYLPPIFRRLHQVSDCPRGEKFPFPTTAKSVNDSLQSVDRRRFPFRRYSYDEDGFLVVRTRNVNRDAYVGFPFYHPFTLLTVFQASPPLREAGIKTSHRTHRDVETLHRTPRNTEALHRAPGKQDHPPSTDA